MFGIIQMYYYYYMDFSLAFFPPLWHLAKYQLIYQPITDIKLKLLVLLKFVVIFIIDIY